MADAENNVAVQVQSLSATQRMFTINGPCRVEATSADVLRIDKRVGLISVFPMLAEQPARYDKFAAFHEDVSFKLNDKLVLRMCVFFGEIRFKKPIILETDEIRAVSDGAEKLLLNIEYVFVPLKE